MCDSARRAFSDNAMPAPAGRRSAARSRMRNGWPRRASAHPSVSPPIPAPAMTITCVDFDMPVGPRRSFARDAPIGGFLQLRRQRLAVVRPAMPCGWRAVEQGGTPVTAATDRDQRVDRVELALYRARAGRQHARDRTQEDDLGL